MTEFKKDNLFLILIFLLVVAVFRNSLELIGFWTGSNNFCCFFPNYASYLNTFTYLLLIIFGGVFWLHLLLKGEREELVTMIRSASFLMLPLFIFVPLLNLVFNYHGPKLPVWYSYRFLIYPLYLPMGSVVGFTAILLFGSLMIKKIYQRSFKEVFVKLFISFLAIFYYTYQIGLWFVFTNRKITGIIPPANVYSWTFLLPVIISFPFFVRAYFEKRNRFQGWFIYALFWLIFIFTGSFLFFYN